MKAKAINILRQMDRDPLSLGVPHDVPPPWTPNLVADALVDAVRMAQRVAGAVGPQGFGANWPKYQHTFADIVGWGDTDEKVRTEVRRLPTAAEVSRMEVALTWQARYLARQPGPARAIKLWLRSKATRVHFTVLIKRQKWPPATAYRARDKALTLIALGLTRDGIPPWRV